MHDLTTLQQLLIGDAELQARGLLLDLDGLKLKLRSNSASLRPVLPGSRFQSVKSSPLSTTGLSIASTSISADAPSLTTWRKYFSRRASKDAYFDVPQARLVLKVRTGMLFLQSESARIASGPCLENDNQVINFINAQYMNWLQQRGWLICHASGLVWNGRCMGIAGFSGGGKSTLMLHLLEERGVSFLTNDRLFLKRVDSIVQAVGIPKLPRINPGTIVHNEKLHGLIPSERREQLLDLPQEELWHLEEKYDVDVEQVYGEGKLVQRAACSHFLLLNWSRESDRPLEVTRVRLADRRELLGAVMKSPGPFYQFADGGFFQDTMELPEKDYIDLLEEVEVMEVTGGVDFHALVRYCRQLMQLES